MTMIPRHQRCQSKATRRIAFEYGTHLSTKHDFREILLILQLIILIISPLTAEPHDSRTSVMYENVLFNEHYFELPSLMITAMSITTLSQVLIHASLFEQSLRAHNVYHVNLMW